MLPVIFINLNNLQYKFAELKYSLDIINTKYSISIYKYLKNLFLNE